MKKRVIKKNGMKLEVINNPNYGKKPKKVKELDMDSVQVIALHLSGEIEAVIERAMDQCKKFQASKNETNSIIMNAISIVSGKAIIDLFPKLERPMVVKSYCDHIKKQLK